MSYGGYGFPHSLFSIEAQVQCVERELSLRRRVYPRWVAQGKMDQDKSHFEIKAMEAVLETLKSQQDDLFKGGSDGR